MRISRLKLVLVVLALSIVGGVIAYALTALIARIFVEVSLPAADVKTYDVRVDVAPYQSFEYSNAWIADVIQRSDLVQYTLKIKAENVQLYDACVTVMSWGVVYYKGCGLEHEFVMKNIPGGFSIYLTVKGKSLDKSGLITAEIKYKPIP